MGLGDDLGGCSRALERARVDRVERCGQHRGCRFHLALAEHRQPDIARAGESTRPRGLGFAMPQDEEPEHTHNRNIVAHGTLSAGCPVNRASDTASTYVDGTSTEGPHMNARSAMLAVGLGLLLAGCIVAPPPEPAVVVTPPTPPPVRVETPPPPP